MSTSTSPSTLIGDERRTFTAQVTLLDIVPGVALHLLGHAPPGRSCSELELEAVAIDWTSETPERAALAVARALARIGEEDQKSHEALASSPMVRFRRSSTSSFEKGA